MFSSKSEFLAEWFSTICNDCANAQGHCHKSRRIRKCLRSEHDVSSLDGIVYTTANDYPHFDARHWRFEGELTSDQLAEVLRGNA